MLSKSGITNLLDQILQIEMAMYFYAWQCVLGNVGLAKLPAEMIKHNSLDYIST